MLMAGVTSRPGRKRKRRNPLEKSVTLRALSDAIDRSSLTQAEIAKRTGYTQGQISELRRLRGKSREKRNSILKRPMRFYEDVAEALGYELILRRKKDDDTKKSSP